MALRAVPCFLNPYELPKLLGEYLLLHYGDVADVLGGLPGPAEAVGFPVRAVRELLARPVGPRALDLGCAVGASTFELSRSCGSVIGIDYSKSFTDAANRMRTAGMESYLKILEGDVTEPAVARLPDGVNPDRVSFECGDAQELREGLADFDVVFAGNLLCRLQAPTRLINRLPSLVRPGGQLLLTTPLTWLEEFTPRENWIGGTAEAGRSFDALKYLLDPNFTLEHVADLPFLIREHSRKFQYGIAVGSRWRRG